MTGISELAEIAHITQQQPLAMVFGLLGLACQLTWPLLRTRTAILTVQLGIGSCYGVQYLMFDAWSGAGVAFLGATQTAIALAAGERPALRKVSLAFLPLVAIVCFATWGGASSLLALTACTLVMIGRMQNDTLALRIFLLAAAPFGIGYDVTVGALPALCGGGISAIVAASMLIREVHDRHSSNQIETDAGRPSTTV